jgi:hypothetical protein
VTRPASKGVFAAASSHRPAAALAFMREERESFGRIARAGNIQAE